MPKVDERQIAIDCAVEALRDAGASTCSVMATWPDGGHKTKLVILWKAKPKQALGRGLAYIQKNMEPVKKLLGKVAR